MYKVGKSFIIVTDPFAASLITGGKYPQLSWQHGKFKICRKNGGMGKAAALFMSTRGDGVHKILARHIGNSTGLNANLIRCQKVIHDQISSLIPREDSIRWIRHGILEFVSRAIFFFSADVLSSHSTLATEENFKLMMKYDSKLLEIFSINSFISRYRLREELDAREILVSRMKSFLLEIERCSGTKIAGTFEEINDYDMSNPNILDLDTRARHLFLLFHASILNTVPTLFWVIYYLLSDKTIYDAVQEEVDNIYEERMTTKRENPNNKNDPSLPHFELADLHNMHKLDSLITEVLRLKSTSRSISTRIATEDFDMILPVDGEKKQFFVKKGSLFITSPTMKHTDEEIFKDAKTFKWDRFVPLQDGKRPTFFKNGRILRTPVTPFGGGKTHCPGRYFAIAEMKLIISWMLLECDIRFKDGEKPAQPELKSPGHKSSNGMPKTDIEIEVRKRSIA